MEEASSSGEEIQGNDQMREVDQANVLNYQTDSEDDDAMDSDDIGAGLEQQKEELQDRDAAWGKSKKDYYKADSDSDDGSENEEDLAKEAMRLQSIRQKKLARQFAAKQQDSEEDEADAEAEKEAAVVSSEEDESSDDAAEGKRKLGDKLFDSDDEGAHEETKKAAELNVMNPELVKKIIESDSPELQGLLEEFKESLS